MQEFPLSEFDFNILEDPSFKEDAVREELVAPLLRSLGFAPYGASRIKRSVALEHPYVSIGSTSRKVQIFPDYILEVDHRNACVIDAKAPWEDVRDPGHLSQAYTYAIHREVKADYYALCNGHTFVLFRTSDMGSKPVFEFDLKDGVARWDEIKEKLSPRAFVQQHIRFKKDFGLHLERLGITNDIELTFLEVPLLQIGRVSEELISISCNALSEDDEYCASFDLHIDLLKNLVKYIPVATAIPILNHLKKWPSLVNIGYEETPITLNITASLGSELIENEHEIYRPLSVMRFR